MSAPKDQDKLRAWLSLLGQANGLRKVIDSRLAKDFGISLSRFDVLAALERGGKDGLKAGALTKMLVVSDGNTTQVTNKLVRDGLVKRRKGENDGRVVIYTLSPEGAKLFTTMAAENKNWISEAFSSFNEEELVQLRALLNKVKFNPKKELDAL